jgi:hypothetical protein
VVTDVVEYVPDNVSPPADFELLAGRQVARPVAYLDRRKNLAKPACDFWLGEFGPKPLADGGIHATDRGLGIYERPDGVENDILKSRAVHTNGVWQRRDFTAKANSEIWEDRAEDSAPQAGKISPAFGTFTIACDCLRKCFSDLTTWVLKVI